MLEKYRTQFSAFIKEKKLEPMVDVAMFILITLVIHFSYRFWAAHQYFPIQGVMSSMHEFLSDALFKQSSWIIQHVLGMDITTVKRTMYWQNQGYIAISHGCSGLKQIIQFVLLMMFFPGPWKRKLWYLPLGALIVHFTNIFRIVGLAVVLVSVPDYWKFSHDYLFRPFFYVVIFSLWVYWVEKLKKK